jgi:hypothetical protein
VVNRQTWRYKPRKDTMTAVANRNARRLNWPDPADISQGCRSMPLIVAGGERAAKVQAPHDNRDHRSSKKYESVTPTHTVNQSKSAIVHRQ